ncbi:hypothetical protein SMD44_p10170 (plasmid) [Streptomyces alboflavus]|uniref:CRISPR-associated protein Cse1 n=1 Tax=Streptomyces alboflavus TaxID=67267 RepID=A0A291W515_9ACTN|nr:type I-E CRISPR-associated protein Cse1/CasA [Streptomyces alboflavus]ATM24669.1 hypothetical protein SMD44_p10170 [Streptomyces alboflavus]
MASFDLLVRPWLPVLTDQGLERLSLHQALARAHEIRLAVQPATHSALLRLLLAVYAAADRPKDEAAWDAAWRAPALDASRTDTYLDTHRGAFDLFSPAAPLWQCAHLATANRGPRVLAAETWGSGLSQFDDASDAPLDPASAAIALAELQSWHPGGIQSGHPDDPATRGGKLYGGKPAPLSAVTHLRITGTSLKQELLLNLPPGARAAGDRPVWERQCPPAAMVPREAAGPLDLWTWPTRRVRLMPDEEGRVAGVALHDGDRPADPGAAATAWDPGAARSGTGGALAVTDNSGHPLPWIAATLLDSQEGASRCPVLDHVVAAAARGTLHPDTAIEAVLVRAAHTTSHRAALSDITTLHAPIGPARVLADPGLRTALAYAARAPWQLQRTVNKAAAAALSLPAQHIGSRSSLAVAAHLARRWEEFADAPDTDAGRQEWFQALTAAAESAGAHGTGGRLMAAGQITAAALTTLAGLHPAPGPMPPTEGARS